jgi:ABC-type molybdate transport system permease subunit
MPPVVTGYVLLLLLGRRGPLGQFLDEHFGIVFAFRRTGAGLARSAVTTADGPCGPERVDGDIYN